MRYEIRLRALEAANSGMAVCVALRDQEGELTGYKQASHLWERMPAEPEDALHERVRSALGVHMLLAMSEADARL